MIIINYIAIGVLLMFSLESLIKINSNKIENMGEVVPQFDNFTRIFCAIIWPITLAIVLKHAINYIKNILK